MAHAICIFARPARSRITSRGAIIFLVPSCRSCHGNGALEAGDPETLLEESNGNQENPPFVSFLRVAFDLEGNAKGDNINFGADS